MPLRLGDGWQTPPTAHDRWLKLEPPFAESRAYRLLLRDLRRYVHEEIAGRSFLIAGHRGAGKTATVAQAVLHTENKMIAGSRERGGEGFSRRGRLQRPLKVKLVGESLIAPPPKLVPAEPKPAEATTDKAEVAAPAPGRAAAAAPCAPPAATPPDTAQSALVHITIALYRALAGEIVERFAQHANRDLPRYPDFAPEVPWFSRLVLSADDRERNELAAQLALELDGTPEPATLRGYWNQIGALRDGVLWPRFAEVGSDQGLREIVAVATAAQAFQVCSGAITYQVTSQDSAGRESKVERSIDVKDLATHLGTLAAGAVSGAIVGSTQADAFAGIGTGLLVWLLGSAVLRWTSVRHRKQQRTLDYTFLRDRSIQTLDRDLPLVIARIREAGLAPVFVIDELDKLKRQAATVGLLIGRLKHLVSDYGFFCFLTDRSYFDAIERKISREPYPTEHTFFGERVLIVNRPDDLFAYIVSMVAPPEQADPAHGFKAAVFALVTMFRSKLNFIDLSRQMDQLTNPNDSLTCSDEDLQGAGRYRLEATIQLAINQILLDDEVAARFEWDPAFAQLAVDALYYTVRRWQENSDAPLNIGRAALEAGLIERMQRPEEEPQPANPPPAKGRARRGRQAAPPAGAQQQLEIPSPDLRELLKMVELLATYLCDFNGLKTAIAGSPKTLKVGEERYDPALFAEIVLTEKLRLMRRERGGAYQFELDELGRVKEDSVASREAFAIRQARRLTPAKAPPKPKRKPAGGAEPEPEAAPARPPSEEERLVEAVDTLLQTTELKLDDLITAAVLPRNLTDSFLSDLKKTLAASADRPNDRELADRAANSILSLQTGLIDSQYNLLSALYLIERVAADMRLKAPRRQILARMSRYFDPSGRALVIWSGMPGTNRLEGNADSVNALTAQLIAWRASVQAAPRRGLERHTGRWDYWHRQVRDFLPGREYRLADILYVDYAFAAADLPPGSLFRIALADMQQVDWSRAALAALRPGAAPKAPFWLLFGALAALGFDRKKLNGLLEWGSLPGLQPTPEEIADAAEMVPLAAVRPPGVLHVYSDGPGDPLPIEIPSSRPMLSVGKSEFETFRPALEWLYSNELFNEGRDETE